MNMELSFLNKMIYCFILLKLTFEYASARKLCGPPMSCSPNSLTTLSRNSSEENLAISDASNLEEHFDLNRPSYLYCCFSAKPHCPEIRWFKDGVPLSAEVGVRQIDDDGRLLHIFSIRNSDAGVYTCQATTPRNETISHAMRVHVQLKCGKRPYLDGQPADREIKVARGSNQTLQCKVYCHGIHPLATISWLKEGTLRRITKSNSEYKVDVAERTSVSGPIKTTTLTIYDFAESVNFTCFFEGNNLSVSHTFHLIPKVCEAGVLITPVPSGIGELVVEKGANRSLKCQFFCLAKERFNEAVWLNENNELIANSTAKYIFTRRENLIRSVGRPDYEITLTILNITTAETVTCFLPNKKNNISNTFQLVLKPEAENRLTDTEVNFFKSTGIWILIACFVVVVALLSSLLLWCKKRVRSWSVFYRPNNKPEIDAKYDAFVSFSEADGGAFVRSTLLPMLEEECGYSLSLHYREFIPGTSIVENIADFIDNSRRIITVVTPRFLKSEWCRFEVDQGLRRAVERPNTLVVIMLDDIPRDELPKTLRHFISKVNFLQWDGAQLEKMREKLSRALGTALTADTTESKKPASTAIAVDDIRLSVGNTLEDMNYIGNFKDTL